MLGRWQKGGFLASGIEPRRLLRRSVLRSKQFYLDEMAGLKGKRKGDLVDEVITDTVETSESDTDSGSSGDFSSSESESDKEKDPEDDDIVNIDFEFFDPTDIDFHGLKSLLRTYLDGEEFGCSELVETIIKQV